MIPNNGAGRRGGGVSNASPGVAASGLAAWLGFAQRAPFSFDNRLLVAALLTGVGYYVGAKIGFALTFTPHPVSVLWPPNAILMSALLLMPRRIWWVILLAALPAHCLVQAQSDVPARMIFCWFISNSCEALIGAGCIRYFLSRPVRFDRLRNVGIFCFFGAFLAPFLSTFLDCGFVALNHWGTGHFWEIWRIRFISNVLAALTITPFIVTWATTGFASIRNLPHRKVVEAACLLAGLFAVSIVLFNRVSTADDSGLLYAPLPFLIWAAVRFGSHGVTPAIALLSFMAVWGVAHGHGPFSEGSVEQNALYAQLFLIFMTVPVLFLGGLIEERNEVEDTLRERDERIGLAAETANLALWTIDFEQHESWMSDKGRELFGFQPGEPLSRETFLGRVHPEDRQRVDEQIERARADSTTFEIEYRVVRPAGDTRWLIARGRYLHNQQGRASELIGVAIDVTPQVKAVLELRSQREEMARLNRLAVIGEVTASLAHEVNQPLSAIVSNAHAGMRFIDKGMIDPAALREILSDMAADGRRATDIIRNARSAIKQDHSIRGQFSLNTVVTDVTRMIHGDAAANSCDVQLSLGEDLSVVEGDLGQIQQVLINLLANAFDAMNETPVNQRKIEIATTGNGDGLVSVSVRDHGSGLCEETRDRLFEQFFTTKDEGLGMGLAIARSIVENHGGRISAENSDGGGARFCFTLPVSKGTQE